MKELLNPAIMEGGNYELTETQKYFRQGDIFYPQSNRYNTNATFKSRPVMIASIMDIMGGDDMVVCCEITTNFNTPCQIPILLNGKISFISPFREVIFSVNDLDKRFYYGSVDSRVLELVKYLKLKYFYGTVSEAHETFMNEYCYRVMERIESGDLECKRPGINPASSSWRRNFLGGKFSPVTNNKDTYNPSEESELVYSTSPVDESFGTTLGNIMSVDLLNAINNIPDQTEDDNKTTDVVEEEIDESIVEEADTTNMEVAVSVEAVETNEPVIEEPVVTAEPAKIIRFRIQNGYWEKDGDGNLILKRNSEMTMKQKMKFLEDLYKAGQMTTMGKKFGVTGQTIRNRYNNYISDLEKAGVTIPDHIMNIVGGKSKNGAKITSPPPKKEVNF